MIKVKLQEIAHKLAKNSSEIARETGINRNTINALMHNKVDGLKFPTIDKLCQTYGLNLTDLIEYKDETAGAQEKQQQMIKQQAALNLFYIWPWITSLGNFSTEYFDYQYSKAFLYIKNRQGDLYQPLDEFQKMASSFYRKYSDLKRLDVFMSAFQSAARAGEQFYLDNDAKRILALSKIELLEFYQKYRQIASRIWQMSLFHESFEAGFEREAVKKIALTHHLNDEEVIALTAMDRPSFHDERRLALIGLARTFLAGARKDIRDFLSDDPRAKEFQKNFGYYKNSMAGPQPQTPEELAQEIKKYITDKQYLEVEYKKLMGWIPDREQRVSKILQRHRLKTNPLAFFSRMAYLRERRKQIVSMTISVGDWILAAVERQTGMDRKYLEYLSYEELSGVLKGLVSLETLKQRSEKPLLVEITKDEYKLILGEEADSIRQELEVKTGEGEGSFVLLGTAGAQGYAKGLARVARSKADLLGLKANEVLVLPAMKQEYLPFISQAAGFVVEDADSAGLTAKTAREWGKPCLVNVVNATNRIGTGDTVDVRANHRSVKVIKK